jgi:hypothetical protein
MLKKITALLSLAAVSPKLLAQEPQMMHPKKKLNPISPISTPSDPISNPGESTLTDCTDEHCKITKALEEQIAWISFGGKDFCAYKKFDAENTESPFYLYISCSEYYIKTEKLDCGDGDNAFTEKENCEKYVSVNLDHPENIDKCSSDCKIEKLSKPELAQGGGMVGPAKVTFEKDGKAVAWQPEENKDYEKSLHAGIPEKYLKNFDKVEGASDDLSKENQERAEKYFDMEYHNP